MHYRTTKSLVVLSAFMLMVQLFSCANRTKQENGHIQMDGEFIMKDSIQFVSGKHDILFSFNVSINDSNNISIAFDTGSPDLTLDYHLCQTIFNMDSLYKNCLCTQEKVEYSYDSSISVEDCIYSPVSLVISGDTIKYERFFVVNDFKDEFGIDGAFSIPKSFNKKVIFSFSEGTYSITNNSDNSNYDFSVNIENDGYFYVLKNFLFSFGNEVVNTDVVLDTGTGSKTITILGPSSFGAILKDKRPIFDDGDYQSFYLAEETGILNDSISIYVNRNASSFDKPLVGLDFLVHFDVCWDVPNQTMWFKRNQNSDPHAYFQQHGAVVNRIRLISNKDCSSAMVLRLGLNDNAYIAGVRPFDILTKVGGRLLDETFPYYRMYCKDNGLECDFEVNRSGNTHTFHFLP